jgi:hypothetical protein
VRYISRSLSCSNRASKEGMTDRKTNLLLITPNSYKMPKVPLQGPSTARPSIASKTNGKSWTPKKPNGNRVAAVIRPTQASQMDLRKNPSKSKKSDPDGLAKKSDKTQVRTYLRQRTVRSTILYPFFINVSFQTHRLRRNEAKTERSWPWLPKKRLSKKSC